MATISDVAREANVSSATASRALNNKASVRPDLAQRVRDAADLLGYKPNAAARSLRKQATMIWALIVPDITNPFFTSIAHGVSAAAHARGFSLLLCNSEEDAIREREYVELAIQEQAAGVIFSPNGSADVLAPLHELAIPVVIVDRSKDALSDTVTSDSRRSTRDATIHLLEQGWEHPAIITGPRHIETAAERLAGYRDAMDAVGRGDRSLHVYTDYSLAAGRIATSKLLSLPSPPDALIAASSTLALGALQEVRAQKIQLGRELGFVSFDEAPWATVIDPPLSVVAQPAFAIGETAGGLLADRIVSGSSERQSIVLSSDFIIRQSSLRNPGLATTPLGLLDHENGMSANRRQVNP